MLSDTHGEIPIQVPEDVLLAIGAAVADYDPPPPHSGGWADG